MGADGDLPEWKFDTDSEEEIVTRTPKKKAAADKEDGETLGSPRTVEPQRQVAGAHHKAARGSGRKSRSQSASPTKKKGKGRGKGKGKGKGRGPGGASGSYAKTAVAGKKECRGCGKKFDIDVFQMNSPYCPDDEAALKRIGRLAKAQGQPETWLKEIRKCQHRVRRLLVKYYEKCPPASATGGKVQGGRKDTFYVAEYIKYEKAQHRVAKTNTGPMMHELRYLKHATETLNYSHKRAQEKWDAMVADPDHPTDQQGPEHSSKQCLITEGFNHIQDSNETITGSEVQVTDKPLKNASAEAIAKLKHKVRYQEDLPSEGEDEPARKHLKRSLASAPSGPAAFAGALAFGDVTQMDKVDDEEDDEHDGQSAKGEASDESDHGKSDVDDDDPAPPEEPAAKKRGQAQWLREDAISKAAHKWITGMSTLREGVQGMHDKITAHLQTRHVHAHAMQGFAQTGRSRLRALALVLSEEPNAVDKLATYIESIKQSGGAGGVAARKEVAPLAAKEVAPSVALDGSGSSQGGRRAPPCPKYEELRTLIDLETFATEFEEVESQAELQAKEKTGTRAKAGIQDLVACSRKVAGDLDRGIKAEAKAAKGKKAETAGGRPVATATKEQQKGETVSSWIDASRGAKIPALQSWMACAVGEAQVDFGIPFLITNLNSHLRVDETIVSAIDFTKTAFFKDRKVDYKNGGSGRGQCKPQKAAFSIQIHNLFVDYLSSHGKLLVPLEGLEARIFA